MEKLVLRPVIGLVQDLSPQQLEGVTIDAVVRHRGLRDQAELSQSTLERAIARQACEEEVEFARRAHIAAMIAMHAHQLALSTLLDVLGFIPDIPTKTSN